MIPSAPIATINVLQHKTPGELNRNGEVLNAPEDRPEDLSGSHACGNDRLRRHRGRSRPRSSPRSVIRTPARRKLPSTKSVTSHPVVAGGHSSPLYFATPLRPLPPINDSTESCSDRASVASYSNTSGATNPLPPDQAAPQLLFGEIRLQCDAGRAREAATQGG